MKSEKTKKKFFFIIIICIVIQIFLSTVLFKDSLYLITSESMKPTLNRGDLVIKGIKSPEDIKASVSDGDILIIKGPEYYYRNGIDPFFFGYLANNTPIIHRAIDKKKIGDTWYFLTKGDNNLIPDGAMRFLVKKDNYYLVECDLLKAVYIPETEILGIVKVTIPYIGFLGIYFPFIIWMVVSIIGFITLTKIIKRIELTIRKRRNYRDINN